MIVDDTIWQGIREKPEFKRRKEADCESYTWDKLVEFLPVGRRTPRLRRGWPAASDLSNLRSARWPGRRGSPDAFWVAVSVSYF